MQDSLKRKLLAGGIAGALVLGVGAVAGAATGSFDNGTPEVGQHHGTEVEHGTTTTSLDPSLAPVPAADPTLSDDGPGHDVGDDNGVDGPGHDVGDDNSGSGSSSDDH